MAILKPTIYTSDFWQGLTIPARETYIYLIAHSNKFGLWHISYGALKWALSGHSLRSLRAGLMLLCDGDHFISVPIATPIMVCSIQYNDSNKYSKMNDNDINGLKEFAKYLNNTSKFEAIYGATLEAKLEAIRRTRLDRDPDTDSDRSPKPPSVERPKTDRREPWQIEKDNKRAKQDERDDFIARRDKSQTAKRIANTNAVLVKSLFDNLCADLDKSGIPADILPHLDTTGSGMTAIQPWLIENIGLRARYDAYKPIGTRKK